MLTLIPNRRPRGRPAKETTQRRKQAAEFRKSVVTLTDPEIDRLNPLEVMLMAMRQAVRDGYLSAAAGHARDAAPYMMPRLAAAVVTHRDAYEDLSIDELRLLLRYASMAPAADRPGGGGEGAAAQAVTTIEGNAD